MPDETIANNPYDEAYGMFQGYEGGVYVAGIDIPLGGYSFSTNEKQGLVKVYAKYKDYLSDRPVDVFTIRKDDTYVSLQEEGMVIKVNSCTMKKELTILKRIEAERKKVIEGYLLEMTEMLSEKTSDNTNELPSEKSNNKRGTDGEEDRVVSVNYREVQELPKDDLTKEFFADLFEGLD